MYLVVETTWHLAPHLREKTTRRTARCQWPSGSFFFFLFVRLCVFFFVGGTEVALVTQLRWTLLEKTGAAIDHLRLRSFNFFSATVSNMLLKNETKQNCHVAVNTLFYLKWMFSFRSRMKFCCNSKVPSVISQSRGGPSIPQSASIITIIIINISVLFLTKPEWERQKLSTVTKDIRATVIATCQFLEKILFRRVGRAATGGGRYCFTSICLSGAEHWRWFTVIDFPAGFLVKNRGGHNAAGLVSILLHLQSAAMWAAARVVESLLPVGLQLPPEKRRCSVDVLKKKKNVNPKSSFRTIRIIIITQKTFSTHSKRCLRLHSCWSKSIILNTHHAKKEKKRTQPVCLRCVDAMCGGELGRGGTKRCKNGAGV